MFLHTSTFKKLVKNAWKYGGVTVGRLDNRSLFVVGNYWTAWFDYTSMPNRIKAVIMEYAGELPEIEEIFVAKCGEPNQYEVKINPYFDVHEVWKQSRNPLIITPVIIDGYHNQYRLLQDKHNQYLTVTTLYNELIDRRECEETEGSVMGPCTADDCMSPVFWATDLCILGIMSGRVEKDEARMVLDALADVDFHKEE